MFGGGAGLVRSDALIRLKISAAAPPGLLAFGTRHPGYFNPGQGTELLQLPRPHRGALRPLMAATGRADARPRE